MSDGIFGVRGAAEVLSRTGRNVSKSLLYEKLRDLSSRESSLSPWRKPNALGQDTYWWRDNHDVVAWWKGVLEAESARKGKKRGRQKAAKKVSVRGIDAAAKFLKATPAALSTVLLRVRFHEPAQLPAFEKKGLSGEREYVWEDEEALTAWWLKHRQTPKEAAKAAREARKRDRPKPPPLLAAVRDAAAENTAIVPPPVERTFPLGIYTQEAAAAHMGVPVGHVKQRVLAVRGTKLMPEKRKRPKKGGQSLLFWADGTALRAWYSKATEEIKKQAASLPPEKDAAAGTGVYGLEAAAAIMGVSLGSINRWQRQAKKSGRKNLELTKKRAPKSNYYTVWWRDEAALRAWSAGARPLGEPRSVPEWKEGDVYGARQAAQVLKVGRHRVEMLIANCRKMLGELHVPPKHSVLRNGKVMPPGYHWESAAAVRKWWDESRAAWAAHKGVTGATVVESEERAVVPVAEPPPVTPVAAESKQPQWNIHGMTDAARVLGVAFETVQGLVNLARNEQRQDLVPKRGRRPGRREVYVWRDSEALRAWYLSLRDLQVQVRRTEARDRVVAASVAPPEAPTEVAPPPEALAKAPLAVPAVQGWAIPPSLELRLRGVIDRLDTPATRLVAKLRGAEPLDKGRVMELALLTGLGVIEHELGMGA